MKIKLEIGCGRSPREGYVHCDVRNLDKVDVVCDTRKIPYKNNSVTEIYSRHCIEHFTLKEFLQVLEEWNRVLKKGGKLYIICPNLLWHLNQILKSSHKSFYEKRRGKRMRRYWGFGSLFGWQQDVYDVHKFGYYFELLRDILIESGFGKIKNFTNKKDSMEKDEAHLEIEAIKIKDFVNYKKSKFYKLFDVKH